MIEAMVWLFLLSVHYYMHTIGLLLAYIIICIT